jgi:16S rRNA (adenine1518-N6/adenine1519-N6)-dimethyltransferase
MKAKKHLGQNFLKSKTALSKIASSAELSEKDLVLEIGPGKGALTDKLLESGARVLAIEKDRDLIPILEEKFQKEIFNKKLQVLEADVLKFEPKKHGLLGGKYKIVANIPYYITGAIFEKFLDGEQKPSVIVLVVQKEVAERACSKDGKESILSISVKVYGDPKMVAKIPARYFSPEPKVDSAILCVKNIKNPFKNKAEKEKFFKILKAGFSSKRKVLKNNLQKAGFSKEILEKAWQELSLSPQIRAEKVTLSDWLYFAKNL